MKGMIDKELEILHKELLFMGSLCEQAIANATKSFIEYDLECANKAFYIEFEVKKKERDIEDLCMKILLRQQPVAKDLRKISSILKIITDMDRIGRQARDIADIVLIADVSRHTNNEHIQEIAKAAKKMVTDSIDAYMTNDLQACKSVILYDSVVDDLFDKVKADIINMVLDDRKNIENGMYLLMIAKYFEKIADHATNIAHWVEFSITGTHKGEEVT